MDGSLLSIHTETTVAKHLSSPADTETPNRTTIHHEPSAMAGSSTCDQRTFARLRHASTPDASRIASTTLALPAATACSSAFMLPCRTSGVAPAASRRLTYPVNEGGGWGRGVNFAFGVIALASLGKTAASTPQR